MSENKCTKRYPRSFTSETQTGNDGYPLYRRRSPNDNGRTYITQIKGADIVVDNTWIVPYSPILCKALKTHINVEFCSSVKSIKYICKYVTKGSDMAVIGVERDEISKFQMGRYVNCNVALWRIFSFAIHERFPIVVHLAVHLENGQRVYFNAENAAERVERPTNTTLTSFFLTCTNEPFSRTLLYSEMPRYYTWNASSKKWLRRKQGKPVDGYPGVFSTDALGRIYTIHPRNEDCFYLRLLLVNVRGPTSFESLRTVDSAVCTSYREACAQLQLLEDDNHWNKTLDDAVSSSAKQVRILFAMIISICHPSNPRHLWQMYKNEISEDIFHHHRVALGICDLQINENIYNEALVLIEDLCLVMSGKVLTELQLPAPNREARDLMNRELERERVAKEFYQNWIVRFGVPLRVTTDQGRQFESHLFKQLNALLGTKHIRITAYHPAANGMIERLHRQLKAALRCHSEDWITALPSVLLGIRTAWKEDLNTTSAELVYGQSLSIPGEFLVAAPTNVNTEPFVRSLKLHFQSIRPTPSSRHGERKIFVHKDLATCSHVFVRHDATKAPLQHPYNGPYYVISKSPHFYNIDIHGKETSVSINRLKPAFIEQDVPETYQQGHVMRRENIPETHQQGHINHQQENTPEEDTETYSTPPASPANEPEIPQSSRTRYGRVVKFTQRYQAGFS